ncbi:MAG: AraC family transcriptional regulator [Marinisporobacter sp.]|nr:AraC family transcriptional regulator [Marinisporobacter sp.]
MKVIHDIISDFYSCCNLPILAVDIDFNKICSIGYTPIVEKFFDDCAIFRDIHFDSDNSLSCNLSYAKDIHFVVVSISRFDKYRGYFIIGPFKCTENNTISIPFKPHNCIQYLPAILLNISDSRFSKGMSNLRFSVHVKKAIEYIHKNYTQSINLDELCNDLSVNKSYFCKVFKKETNFTFSNFLNNYRIEKSKYFLENTNLSLMDVAISVGFNTQNYYSIVFKRFTKKTPLEYRNSIAIQ